MKKIILLTIAIIASLIALLLFKSTPVDPVAYTPPKTPSLTGVLTPNTFLQKAVLLGKGKINGPEDVAIDNDGRIYGGTQDGKIVRILQDDSIEIFAETKGRPLGIQFDKEQNLIVCDAYKGLLSIDLKGNIEVLCTSAEGIPFAFTDALDIASDGSIYFTDS